MVKYANDSYSIIHQEKSNGVNIMEHLSDEEVEKCEICNHLCLPGEDIQLEGSLRIKHPVHSVCVKNAQTVAKWYNGGSIQDFSDVFDARLKLKDVNGNITEIHDFLEDKHWFDEEK